jgi:hypothetical protein
VSDQGQHALCVVCNEPLAPRVNGQHPGNLCPRCVPANAPFRRLPQILIRSKRSGEAA